MNEDISGILKHWEDKQIHSSVLKKKYNECAEKYKNLDKTFRSAISLCSLVAAYTITFQKSDNDQKISVPIIIFSHKIRKNKLLEAIHLIEKQDFVLNKITIIAIESN